MQTALKVPTAKYRAWVKRSTPWEVFFPKRGPVKGQRRFFQTEEAANAEIALWLKGDRTVAIGKRLQDEVQYVVEHLPEGVSLTDMLRYYLAHHVGVTDVTVDTLGKDYLLLLKKQNKSEDYQTEQARWIDTVNKELGAETLFSSLNKKRLVSFINEPETYWNRYGRKRILSCLISKAREVDAIKANPLEGWKFEAAPKKTPHILRQDDVEIILEYVREHMPHVGPAIALQFFAGIRTEELCRNVTKTKRPLAWTDLTFGVELNIPVSVSKTNDDRWITFWPDALTHWLNVFKAERKGVVCPVVNLDQTKYALIKRMNAQREADKLPLVDFEQNDFRRTYASHAYAIHGPAVTDWTGHSLKVLRKSYKNHVKKDAAESYFQSKPKNLYADNVIKISA